jgi:hypothetical protein
MTSSMTWLAALATVAVLVFYEVALAIAQRRSPERLARSAHATLRQSGSRRSPSTRARRSSRVKCSGFL